jgi:hypothetical protein
MRAARMSVASIIRVPGQFRYDPAPLVKDE